MKRIGFFVPLLLLCGIGVAMAQNATFKEVNGKVEYQLSGSAWKPAKIGVTVPAGTLVSTGFKSTATLLVSGSLISVKPLTRLNLENLVKTSGGTQTTLTLLAGKVKTEVKPSSEANQTQFTVKSPTATASVRGTGFEFDGVNLVTNHGEVVLSNTFNISRTVRGGEFASAGVGSVTPPIPVKPAEKGVLTSGGGDGEVTNFLGEGGGFQDVSDLSSALDTFGSSLYEANNFSDLETLKDTLNEFLDQPISPETNVIITLQ